ncbi:MAG: SWIM zinc finger family protein [Polyangiaceae bacterium]
MSPLTESDLHDRFDTRTFDPGRRYFEEGRVFATRLQGGVLRARCEGSTDDAYDIEIKLIHDTPGEARCTCPVGEAGRCKHVVAALLTYARHSSDFVELESLDDALARRTRDDLVSLIRKIVQVHPSAEDLIVAPISEGPPSITPDRARARASAVLDAFASGASAARIAANLQRLIANAAQARAAGDPLTAGATYEAISAEVLRRYDALSDPTGALTDVLRACADGAAKCLEGVDSPHARAAALRALFVLFEIDLFHGDSRVSEERLLHATRPDDRSLVASWARTAIASIEPVRRSCGKLLARLEGDSLDEQGLTSLLRDTEQHVELTKFLLARGRTVEAANEATQLTESELLEVAPTFEAEGADDLIEGIIAARAARSRRVELLLWWRDKHEQRVDAAGALRIGEMIFSREPTLARYRELRARAAEQGGWAELRARLLAMLNTAAHEPLLIDVLIDDGELDAAIERVRHQPRQHGFGHGLFTPDHLSIRVAEAASESRPDVAIELYERHVEGLIEQRGRHSYAEAARVLVKAKQVAARAHNEERVTAIVSRLRSENAHLRALHEELDAAGL